MKGKSLYKRMTIRLLGALMLAGLVGCGSGSGAGSPQQQALLDQINQLFPFTPNQPFNVTFLCGRLNSSLAYNFEFFDNGVLRITTELNNGAIVEQSGTYTYQNDQIDILVQGTGADLFFLLDERGTNIESQMGMVYRFETPNMQCVAIGHRLNDPMQEFAIPANYQCPTLDTGAATDDENAFEFVHINSQAGTPVPGSAFRQRDVYVVGDPQPHITRGYGIYRRQGEQFYIYFPNIFDDVNVFSGRFNNNNTSISIDQAGITNGDCPRS